MKKYLILITLVLITLLSACQTTNTDTEIDPPVLTLTANYDSITPTSVLAYNALVSTPLKLPIGDFKFAL